MKGGNFPRYLTCAVKYSRIKKSKGKPSSQCYSSMMPLRKRKNIQKNVDRINKSEKFELFNPPPPFDFLQFPSPTSKINFNGLSLIK